MVTWFLHLPTQSHLVELIPILSGRTRDRKWSCYQGERGEKRGGAWPGVFWSWDSRGRWRPLEEGSLAPGAGLWAQVANALAPLHSAHTTRWPRRRRLELGVPVSAADDVRHGGISAPTPRLSGNVVSSRATRLGRRRPSWCAYSPRFPPSARKMWGDASGPPLTSLKGHT